MWYGRGGVGTAGTRGNEDLPLPGNVRRYYYTGTSHGGGAGGFSVAAPSLPGIMLAAEPNPAAETRRAVFLIRTDAVNKSKMAQGRHVAVASNRAHGPS